jgi:hypothetical protein
MGNPSRSLVQTAKWYSAKWYGGDVEHLIQPEDLDRPLPVHM